LGYILWIMSRKKRKFESNLHPADGYFEKLKYKDMKRECVIRQMPFEMVISADIPQLHSWFFIHFFDTPLHYELLDQFDDWQEEKIKESLESKGDSSTTLIHSSLRLGYIAEKDEDGNTTKKKRAKTVIKRLKKKRERTTDNIFQGTKKAYTFELQQKGKPKEEVIKEVMIRFPEASEKSINIWFNKSKKLHKIKIGG
jgi:hypothetical protein